jgi:hypothetical protein
LIEILISSDEKNKKKAKKNQNQSWKKD